VSQIRSEESLEDRNLKDYEKLRNLLNRDLGSSNRKRSENQQLCEEILQQKVSIKDIQNLTYCEDIVLLPKEGNLYVFGDTHGDSKSVTEAVESIRRELTKNDYIVFLGDYVNNGLDSIGTLINVLELKYADSSKEILSGPDKIILLSGNHEFRETYYTVLEEYFGTHWNNAIENPVCGKKPPCHYGHVRLDFIKSFGIEKGEEIYELFERWGKSLPYIAFSAKGVMMSHSIGLSSEFDKRTISFGDLAKAKQDPRDTALFKTLGYEAWRKQADTLHARMVNNDKITPELLDKFGEELGVNVFVVGHRHYRSGDIHEKGEMKWCDVKDKGRFVTICSSYEKSGKAGHYIENEFNWARKEKKEEGRKLRAKSCYALFTESEVTLMDRSNIKEIGWNVDSCHS
jgi:hypothetical protein